MSYAYFRLPHSQLIYRNTLHDEPEEIGSMAELNGRRGFVIAPFAPDSHTPILLLPAQWQPTSLDTGTNRTSAHLIDANYDDERRRYADDFSTFHKKLADGTFDKIVLARSSLLTATENIPPIELFARAAERYPRMFIALFNTRQSGTWLVATPETLIGGQGGNMHTMALAGTMRLGDSQLGFDVEGSGFNPDSIRWSDKNRKEQQYVETYIRQCVEQFSSRFSVEGPYTARAGDLVHLRSDIRFCMNDTARLGDIAGALHPTPAVSGMPKVPTQRFITHHESAPRSYYSGFAGPIDPDGDTRLFVTLRCMNILGTDGTPNSTAPSQYRLYAGGGLLADSTEQAEWDEPEAKMNTMRQLFKYV